MKSIVSITGIVLVVAAVLLLVVLVFLMKNAKNEYYEQEYYSPPAVTNFAVNQPDMTNIGTAVVSWTGSSQDPQYNVVYGTSQTTIENGQGVIATITPTSGQISFELSMPEIFSTSQMTEIANTNGYVAVMPAIGGVGYNESISPMIQVTGAGCTSVPCADGCPGVCSSGETCVNGTCTACTPTTTCSAGGSCASGSDGCGGVCTCPTGQTCVNGTCTPITCDPACTSPIETCVNGVCSPLAPTTPSTALSEPKTLHDYSVPSQLNPPGIYYVAYSLTNPSDTTLASEIGPYVELNAEVPFNGLTITIPSSAAGWNLNVYMTDPLDTASGWWMVNTIPSTITASSSGTEAFVFGLW